ncbi:MAG TPA: hypothetical protein PLV46_28125, partial [Reyranella sp.]|uniref:hypothetical protein n=1 Tax=Reyranella sp. TaxID=1929291 RepID=UPI002D0756BE
IRRPLSQVIRGSKTQGQVNDIGYFSVCLNNGNLITGNARLQLSALQQSPINPLRCLSQLHAHTKFASHDPSELENRLESLFAIDYVEDKPAFIFALVQKYCGQRIIAEDAIYQACAVTLMPTAIDGN